MSNSILQVEAYDAEVCRIVQEVLMTMTEYPVVPCSATYHAQADQVTCAVYYAGAWGGAVLIECPLSMAFAFTSRLMRIPRPREFDSDVHDALGELANMVGGNLKSLLPKGAGLSMPSVVQGTDYSLHICGTRQKQRMAFDGPDGPFRVTLVETDTPGELP